VELGYSLEHFTTDIPDPQAGFGGINARISDSLRVSATVQHQRKFSVDDTRGGGGIEWLARRNVRVHAGALFGADADVLPRADGYGGIAYQYGRATWTFDIRVADFDLLRVNVAGGGWRFALPQQSAIWVNYYRFATDYEAARSDVVHSWVLGGSGRVTAEWTLGAEYTRGPDQLHMLTIDRTGEFEADTFSAIADFRLTPMFSLDARYDYQVRPNPFGDDPRVHRATVRGIQRF
jgi:YaiO family outer membrane protein